MSRPHFALDQAHALLPRIRRLLGEAMQLHMHLRRAVRDVDDAGYTVDWGLLNGEIELSDDAAGGDLMALEKARALYRAVRERVLELQDIGVEVRGVVDGMIDFASLRDGETEVWLTWRMGDDRITHYHEADEGLAGRRPLGDHEFLGDTDVKASAKTAAAPTVPVGSSVANAAGNSVGGSVGAGGSGSSGLEDTL